MINFTSIACLPGEVFDYIAMQPCPLVVPPSYAPDDDTSMSPLAWAFILVPIATVILVVWCAVVMRRREDRVLAGPHPEDAYVEIGGIKIRKSTIRMGVAAYVFKHDIAPGLGNGLRGANRHIPPDNGASHGL